MSTPVKGTLIAAAVAGMFAARIAVAEQPAAIKGEAKKVHCEGVNECRGKGECGGAQHECAGQNACKGKGWISMTEEECNAKKAAMKK
jgi:hypothetical protein